MNEVKIHLQIHLFYMYEVRYLLIETLMYREQSKITTFILKQCNNAVYFNTYTINAHSFLPKKKG